MAGLDPLTIDTADKLAKCTPPYLAAHQDVYEWVLEFNQQNENPAWWFDPAVDRLGPVTCTYVAKTDIVASSCTCAWVQPCAGDPAVNDVAANGDGDNECTPQVCTPGDAIGNGVYGPGTQGNDNSWSAVTCAAASIDAGVATISAPVDSCTCSCTTTQVDKCTAEGKYIDRYATGAGERCGCGCRKKGKEECEAIEGRVWDSVNCACACPVVDYLPSCTTRRPDTCACEVTSLPDGEVPGVCYEHKCDDSADDTEFKNDNHKWLPRTHKGCPKGQKAIPVAPCCLDVEVALECAMASAHGNVTTAACTKWDDLWDAEPTQLFYGEDDDCTDVVTYQDALEACEKINGVVGSCTELVSDGCGSTAPAPPPVADDSHILTHEEYTALMSKLTEEDKWTCQPNSRLSWKGHGFYNPRTASTKCSDCLPGVSSTHTCVKCDTGVFAVEKMNGETYAVCRRYKSSGNGVLDGLGDSLTA
jgi:hypothetical protein